MATYLKFDHTSYREQDDSFTYSEFSMDRPDTYTTHSLGDTFRIVYPHDIYDLVVHQKVFPGKEYILLYAVYSTGDSFGHDQGAEIEFIELFTDAKDAKELEMLLRHSEGNSVFFNRMKYYIPWNGYFDHLDSLEQHVVRCVQ